ncbi:hypothetical protein HMPREF1990_02113 [Porphyromonas gingivalis W4087]|uniref:Uncharacterized protein n=1 Tax=Porphyromonas gingivalis (strain ATCC 33277 / DSM 20709 / CIP 103683 / JCM 12257 / NCTC 11834 / 2561) TaxID=431947 RepID=B2RI65_PORG3|nr:hypothetical protein A343_0283 [Porphyromonas gingivalis JCVI SC001]ERJ68821.1 hypothetical protein HMPREF1553_00867 [Porphyromonas gingivalis F0568]ERJ80928.1 hypothetical protein HMPREF1988_02168 [Porphyromonas gingivalis F0185]ERJ85762.1 hypothetical protein HMPREF1990_02113 [Porphyromonas gingivalis W4087]BAG33060.1 hypothetical protein PGN_0541 [Porphyromonas gingivalis ATCC 33277]
MHAIDSRVKENRIHLYDVKKDWFYDDILVFGKTKIQKPILLNRERVVTVEVFLRLRYH